MIIEVKGVGFENKGAYLMLVAIVAQLKLYWPEARIALSHSPNAFAVQRSSITSLRKIALRKHRLDLNWLSYWIPLAVRRNLVGWGWVTEADIDLLVDASGFSYSDQWPSKIRIIHLASELKRFNHHSKPYIFLPQAFGPFERESSCRRIASSFQFSAMVCAREHQSYQHVQSLTGPLPNLYQYGDFTNLAEGFVPQSFDHQTRRVCIVPNKNMLNLRNSNKAWLTRYESMLIEAIGLYRERGLAPFFLNHEGDEDGALIGRINTVLAESIPVITEIDPLAVKGIIGASEAVLCSRYHGCISAMSQGIPCIGTSWSHKYDLLYDQYGARSLLLQPETSYSELERIIDLSLQKDAELFRKISRQALALKAESNAMWAEFEAVVSRYSPFSGSSSR